MHLSSYSKHETGEQFRVKAQPHPYSTLPRNKAHVKNAIRWVLDPLLDGYGHQKSAPLDLTIRENPRGLWEGIRTQYSPFPTKALALDHFRMCGEYDHTPILTNTKKKSLGEIFVRYSGAPDGKHYPCPRSNKRSIAQDNDNWLPTSQTELWYPVIVIARLTTSRDKKPTFQCSPCYAVSSACQGTHGWRGTHRTTRWLPHHTST